MTSIYRPVLTFILLICALSLYSQDIKFQESPEDFQLYARDKSDSALVSVRGKLDKNLKPEAISLLVFKDNLPYSTQNCDLNKSNFSASSKIHAGLHEFRFELHLKGGIEDRIIIIADSVVCGDAYIITGQSNSHASSMYSNYSSEYCRSFGVKTGYEAYNDDDKAIRWGRATGNCAGLTKEGGWFKKNNLGVGAWGMELMRLIEEKHNMPVCIINGGSGSSSIEQNMLKGPEESSLETSFGRLAYRVNEAGLKDQVKAIFWHQGESNSNKQQEESTPEKNYKIYSESFDILYNDWKRVYTELEKVYIFQLHPGCGGEFQSEMRETQTQIAKYYQMIDIMSTTGVVGHDGCHYAYAGYCEFAERLLPLVSRDMYDEKPEGIITPPQLTEAVFNTPGVITLQFDQALVMEDSLVVNGKTHHMKDQFFFDEDKKANLVEKAFVEGSKVVLFMKDSTLYKQVTYLPNKCYLNSKDVYEGPWLFGENNIGALSFDTRTIELPEQVGTRSQWKGYDMLDSTLNGVEFKIVFPQEANENRDWIWRARFWGHEPQTDLALLEQGFHVAYIEVGGLFGSPKATKIWDDFYAYASDRFQLNKKVVLEGMSRGGLIIFNWANQNADKVACIYGDNPVCDFKSWPGGKYSGEGSAKEWKQCLSQYGFDEYEASQAKTNPIDHMENVAKAQVPILCMIGDVDKVVPFAENTALVQAKLQEMGWDMTILHKPEAGHHPHSLKDPKPIVDFILINTGNKEQQVTKRPEWSMNNVTLRSDFRNCKLQFEEHKMGHVAFLGGSITEMEGYRPMISTYLEEQFPTTEFNFTNAGIASTGSTTGSFRMERDVLSKGPLDLLFVEFAVNDDQDAADSYEEAILGMEAIIRKARNHNPNVDIVITYFVNPSILNAYQNGKTRPSIAAHEAVARHYNISTCNLAKEVADQITIGTLDWKIFGGTHPHPYGNSICANMITAMLEKAWSTKTSMKNPREKVNPLNFENGHLANAKDCDFDKKWSYGVPNWNKLKGDTRERFTTVDMLSTTKKGAELKYEFSGTAVGAYVVSGPDAGIVEVSIDGGEYEEFDLYHKYSKNLHYPQTVIFSADLEKGEHSMTLRMLKKTSSKGNAMRIMNFVVN